MSYNKLFLNACLFAALIFCMTNGIGCKQRRVRSSAANSEDSSINAQLEGLAIAIEADSREIMASADSESSASSSGLALDQPPPMILPSTRNRENQPPPTILPSTGDRETEALQVAVRSLQNAYISIAARRSSMQQAATTGNQQTSEASQQRQALDAAAVIARDLATTWSMRLREVSSGRAAVQPQQRELWVELQTAAGLVNAALDRDDVEGALAGLRRLTGALSGAQVAVSSVAAVSDNSNSAPLPAGAATTAPSTSPSSSSSSPTVTIAPSLGRPIATLGVGRIHSCALTDGKIYCWGNNDFGQIGDGSLETRRSPVLVMDGAKFLSVGDSHNCAINLRDQAFCWGMNNNFQTGVAIGPRPTFPPFNNNTVLRPTVLTALGPVAKIAVGGNHTCAIKLDKTVTCFGANWHGESGLPGPHRLDRDDGTVNVHSASIANLTDVTDLAVGWTHNCALKSDHTVRCWGPNNLGQHANPESNRPVRNPGSGPHWEYARGTVYTPAHAGIRNITKITANLDYTCGQRADSTVICWGALGQGGTAAVVDDFSSHNARFGGAAEIFAGLEEICALMQSNQVQCLSLRRLTHNEANVLERLPAGADRLTQFSAGIHHQCVIKNGNSVVCWGHNDTGQLGNNSNQNSERPVTVAFPPYRP